ncbi:hypothetical protein ElyMa_006610500 [Elysia marginata]|uniref:Uncharacterized protein n=1 Tax=Elysia marginata TaxID=1093978 RepID=A0AAV4IJX0_9GAST|nr:hypothetical protein ElyMa_006610500 [Elysia marginata]
MGEITRLKLLTPNIKESKWGWLGPVFRRQLESLIRRTLRWTLQRMAKGDLEEDGGEGPVRKRSFPRNGSPNRNRPAKRENFCCCLKYQTLKRGWSKRDKK